MNKKSSLLAFMLGMAVGSAITWQMIKDRYERRIEEDRKSLEAMYSAKKMTGAVKPEAAETKPEEKPAPDPKELAERAKDKPDIGEYAKRLQGEGYTKTIVLWADGTKTISTCGESDTFDPYAGFCAAVAKKVFGSTGAAKRILKNVSKITPAKKEKTLPETEG